MVVIHDELPSTMTAAHQLAEAGAPAGQAVVARRQRDGHGRHGRPWSSEPGGLWLSVVCRPDGGRGLDAMSLRIGLGIANQLERHQPDLPRLDLKWPNDLFLGGRKLGGILVETRWQGDRCAWAVVGVGINVRNALPAELAESATRLADWLGDGLDPIDLAAPLAVAITTAARGGPLDDLELAAWRTRDALIGHPVSAPLAGIADGITASGALVVRSPDGTRHACPAGVVAITD